MNPDHTNLNPSAQTKPR